MSNRSLPLLLFSLAVATVVLIDRFRQPPDPYLIVRTRADVDRIVAAEAALRGRDLTPEEKRAAVEAAVTQEVLVREARRRGAHRGDPRVREAVLGSAYAGLMEDVPDPTPADLRAWYEAHSERFLRPEAITFEQRLTSGRAPLLSPRVTGISRTELTRLLGREFAAAVFDLEPGTWHGPFASTLGTHEVRILERRPPALPPFEEIEPYLREDWTWSMQRKKLAPKLAEIRARYRVTGERP